MSNLEIVIATEAGEGIGYGHLSRMNALAEAFLELGGAHVELVVADIKNPLDAKNLPKSDIVVIDSYLAPLGFYIKVVENAKVAVFIDDFDRLDYPEGIVLKSPKLLRGSFWNVPQKEVKENVEDIFITIGGLDTHNTMPRLIRAARGTYPNAHIKAVVSPNFTNMDDMKSASDERVELLSALSAQQMQELMSASDIAISGGGQTLCELCACGVPTLVICFADNQKSNIADLESKEAVAYVCEVPSDALESKLQRALEAMRDKSLRANLSHAARQAIDTNGALNLAKKITEAVCRK